MGKLGDTFKEQGIDPKRDMKIDVVTFTIDPLDDLDFNTATKDEILDKARATLAALHEGRQEFVGEAIPTNLSEVIRKTYDSIAIRVQAALALAALLPDRDTNDWDPSPR